ncbi:SUMF1/EgtB/PvdO family nonheme iron enzyme [Desulfococcaceae bacterium HSG7]|nr:SUMF1/EgtB/PvdO family nonheme iron enzyme [Desulfococcaceae bacterium HSG7]
MKSMENGGTTKGIIHIMYAVATLAVLVTVASAGEKPLPIIPGTGGFGMETPAGSGRHLDVPKTRVIKVTNLNNSGPGSFREALTAKGPRVAVFEVSGYIELDSTIGIKNPYLTVAGQTAPWPGIVLRGGYKIVIRTHDVLLRHIGIRPGGQIKGSYIPHRGAMSVGGENVVIDHCSMGWSQQAAVNVNGRNVTLRLNIFSEGLYHAGHNEANHSMGIGIGLGHQKKRGKREGIAVIGNLFAHNDGRNPQVSENSTAALLNNVMYNYAGQGIKMMKDPLIASIAGNVFIRGVDTVDVPRRPWRGKAAWIYLSHPESRVFLSRDNLIEGKMYDNPWEHINARYVMFLPHSKPEPRAIVWESPVRIPGYEVKRASETEEWMLANVGPHPAQRGPIDARIVYETRMRTGRGRDDVADAGGWPKLEENRRELTIPENPNADDDNDGYTNLEEWLHAFADEVEGRKGLIAGTDPTLGKREAVRCEVKPDTEKITAKIKMIRKLPKADWTFNATEAKRRQKKAAEQAGLSVTRRIDLGDGVAIELVFIPPGEFMIGSKYPPAVTKWRGPGRIFGKTGGGGSVPLYGREYPARRVRISKPFYMGKYEVTREVWGTVMGNKTKGDARLPALAFTARKKTDRPGGDAFFIRKLNETVGKREGLRFRLPTEVEWEYACRAGTDTPFWFGETITTDLANYDGRFPWDGKKGVNRGELMEVGSFAPNPWGLYDTVGNATELVNCLYGPYPETDERVVDARIWTNQRKKRAWGSIRTIRGGSYRSTPADCRSAYGAYLAVYGGRERSGLRLAVDSADLN